MFVLVLGRERQQRHIPGAFDRLFCFSLTARAVTAALSQVDLSAIGQKLLKRRDIFVIDVFDAAPAKSTLRLLARSDKTRFSSIVRFLF
jgi:outer membrane lipopolysaccharide assembly protein LptE/RlpB